MPQNESAIYLREGTTITLNESIPLNRDVIEGNAEMNILHLLLLLRMNCLYQLGEQCN